MTGRLFKSLNFCDEQLALNIPLHTTRATSRATPSTQVTSGHHVRQVVSTAILLLAEFESKGAESGLKEFQRSGGSFCEHGNRLTPCEQALSWFCCLLLVRGFVVAVGCCAPTTI